MAVEMLDFRNFNEREVHKAASATLESVQNLIHLLSQQQQNHEGDMNYGSSSTADAAVNRLKKAVSMFGNTRGHARFRKAPSGSSPYCHFPKLATTPETEQCKKEFQYAQDFNSVPVNNKLYYPTPLPPPPPNTFIQKHNLTFPEQSNTSLTFPSQGLQMIDKRDFSGSRFKACKESVTSLSSPISSLTASGVDPCDNNSNNNKAPCVLVESLAVSVRPPWSSAKKSCSHAKSDDVSGKCATAGRCHCSKRKKSRVKRTLRVPAISLKMADIPSDEFSWRKYGQKPIKGSPHPRGYYKCSTVRGCPARKHVERAVDDPNVLIVTYEGEHYHSQSQAMSESTGLVVDP